MINKHLEILELEYFMYHCLDVPENLKNFFKPCKPLNLAKHGILENVYLAEELAFQISCIALSKSPTN